MLLLSIDMSSSAGNLDNAGFTFTPPPFIMSFTELLSGSGAGDVERPGFNRGGRAGVPKFKSAQPPSLPITPPASTLSYFSIPAGLSPTELLDSPVLLNYSHILASPTTGGIPAQRYDWKASADLNTFQHNELRRGDSCLVSFSFQAVKSNATVTSQTNYLPLFKVHT